MKAESSLSPFSKTGKTFKESKVCPPEQDLNSINRSKLRGPSPSARSLGLTRSGSIRISSLHSLGSCKLNAH